LHSFQTSRVGQHENSLQNRRSRVDQLMWGTRPAERLGQCILCWPVHYGNQNTLGPTAHEFGHHSDPELLPFGLFDPELANNVVCALTWLCRSPASPHQELQRKKPLTPHPNNVHAEKSLAATHLPDTLDVSFMFWTKKVALFISLFRIKSI